MKLQICLVIFLYKSFTISAIPSPFGKKELLINYFLQFFTYTRVVIRVAFHLFNSCLVITQNLYNQLYRFLVHQLSQNFAQTTFQSVQSKQPCRALSLSSTSTLTHFLISVLRLMIGQYFGSSRPRSILVKSVFEIAERSI